MKITEAFERGEFAVTAEVGPPKGIHIEIISLLLCVLVLWAYVRL